MDATRLRPGVVLLASLALAACKRSDALDRSPVDTTPVVREDGWKVARDESIEVRAPEAVADAALRRATEVIHAMLANAVEVRRDMALARFKVEIIPKGGVLSDLPDYASFRGKRTADGRSYDTGTRGLGGADMCSVGEENLLCLPEQPYREEDILVHELSHSIAFHLPKDVVAAIDAAYAHAVTKDLYPKSSYMMASSEEYWAEAVQAWFGVTRRVDVNGGFNTKDKLVTHDPEIGAVLQRVFGATDVKRAPGCRY